MKKTLVSIAAVSLMSVAGFASAAEPMQLSEMQMDTVAAGTNNNNGGKLVVTSTAGGSAVAGYGYAGSSSKSAASVRGVKTYASNHSKAFGFLVGAESNAGSQIKIKF